MAVSYEEARDLVRAELAAEWSIGTFWIDESRRAEDDTIFLFFVGAREFIVDGNLDFASVGTMVPVVTKSDGEFHWVRGGASLHAAHPELWYSVRER
jgi:hypothetical protein